MPAACVTKHITHSRSSREPAAHCSCLPRPPAQIRAKVAVPCGAPGCSHDAMRFKVMMYDDGEGELGRGCRAELGLVAPNLCMAPAAAARLQSSMLAARRTGVLASCFVRPRLCTLDKPLNNFIRSSASAGCCPCAAAECITPDDVMELMEEDVKAADLVRGREGARQHALTAPQLCWVLAVVGVEQRVGSVVVRHAPARMLTPKPCTPRPRRCCGWASPSSSRPPPSTSAKCGAGSR